MERAFNTMDLPLGGYQQALLNAYDLGTQFTRGGTEPRTLVMTLVSPMGSEQPFTNSTTLVMLSEEAQRHLIAALQANLDDDQRRAHELIAVFHPEYGTVT